MNYLSIELQQLNLDVYMREALIEAELAGQAGEYPIGAVVVIDSEIVSRGRATHQASRSQIRHAELNAILNGGERLWTEYRRSILFTTLEPCPLCLGAAVMADTPHIIFGLHDQVIQSGQIVETNSYVHRHIKSYYGGVLADESAALWSKYDPRSLAYIQTGHN
ncbi:MAG: nucleoside deaminase [Chloroflexi bacterium]|nr:nucleoside deaminase [Chloroflexota bacterium]MCL5273131.1 nucleoside deaminase [Chloroflexota bacterium]